MNSLYSNEIREFTIAPGCPWYEAQQSFGAPNVNWCEPTVCAIINEPANTWSNLGYIIAGLILMRVITDPTLRKFGPTLIAVGLLSGIYHASNNYLTQFGDFIGMFLMMAFLITFNLRRVFTGLFKNFFATYWFLIFVNTAIFMTFDILNMPVQKIMMINAIPILALDIFAGLKEGKLHLYKYFALAFICLVCAQVFSIVDLKRIYCEPENSLLHGHVLWHMFSAAGLFFMGLHIQKMKSSNFFN